MPLRVARTVKKVLTGVAAVVGLGTSGSLTLGTILTGELILDAVLLIGCLIIIGINGAEGLPDWLNKLLKSKMEK